VRHSLIADAGCLVVVAGRAPMRDRRTVLLVLRGHGDRSSPVDPVADLLSAELGCRVVRVPEPRSARDAAAMNTVAVASKTCRLTVVRAANELCAGLRTRLGVSRTDTLIETSACPVLVVPHRSRTTHQAAR
jgi:hypothetical protein